MEAQSRVAAESNEQQDQLDANVDGHEKKSMFHSVKDKVKHLNAKVRKNIKARQGHGETHEEEDDEDEEEEDEEEEQYRTPRKSDENAGHAAKPLVGLDTHGMQDKPHSKEEIRGETMMATGNPNEDLSPYKETEQAKGGILETETDVGTPSMTQRAEEVVTEDTETTPQDKVSEVGEGNELASITNPPNVTEKVESGASQKNSGFMGKASGLAQGMKGVFAGKQSSNDNVEDNEGPRQQQSEVGGVGHAKENLVKFGSGPYSAEKQEEESQILAGKAQDKDCEDGEVNELASNTKPPNSTEEVKSGTPETGYGVMRKASGLAQGLKGVFAGNESSKDNVKDNDTVLQEDFKEKDDEGLQKQQSETEAKAGQSYVEKLYAAKAAIGTKLGYGGQTNQENNATRESKSCDPIQVPRSGTGTEAMEGAKESKKSPVVSKLSPGEDDKALSKVITGAVSSVKDTIVGGFYGGKEKSPTTTDTTMGASKSTPRSPSSNASGGKGIVDRVTGVVGSFVGRKQGEDSAISPSSPKQEPNPVVQIEKQMAELRVQPDQPTGKSELQNEESTLMEH